MSLMEMRHELNHNLAHPLNSHSLPELPKRGALVKVCFAGACFAEGHGHRRGVRPSLPGFEIAGVLQDMCNDLSNSNYQIGDKVIIYPDEKLSTMGFQDYIAIDNADNLIQVPKNISLEVAAMLPGAALTAFCAVNRAKPHVEKLLNIKPSVNVLIVGGGGQGLWTLQVASWLMKNYDADRLHVTVADDNIDRLLCALEHGCFEVIHWNEEDHEQYIIERTKDACRGGIDIVIDYIGSPRTMKRTLCVLNNDGLVLVGGLDLAEVNVNLKTLSDKQQSIVGIPKGSHEQLQEVVQAVSTNNLKPPFYCVYSVDEAAQVFEDLGQSRIIGRAVLRFHNVVTTTDN